MRYLDKLEEAKKRPHTYKEIDAYARGREKATMARRKKEFEDFYSDPKKKKKAELEEAKVDKGKPYGEKTRARSRRNFERAYQHASDTGEGKVGKMIRSKDFRKTAVLAARARRQEAAEKKLKEAYTLLGDTLAEAMLGEARVNKKIEKSTKAMGRYLRGDRRDDQTPETAKGRAIKAGEDLTTGQRRAMHKEALKLKKRDEGLSEGIRSKVADKLDKFSRKQYKKGEVDDASGKPKRAGMRGRAAHVAGKVAQRVRPKDKS